MNLSKHFTLAEFVQSQTAARKGLSNTPSEIVVGRLVEVAGALEKVRDLLGGLPIIVNSGYRSEAVNKAIGGVPSSAHCKGFAVDFICPAFGTPLEVCRAITKSGIRFDQLIEEGTWVHLSIDTPMRQQMLTMRNGKYSQGLSA